MKQVVTPLTFGLVAALPWIESKRSDGFERALIHLMR
jgi:hypothetical protein